MTKQQLMFWVTLAQTELNSFEKKNLKQFQTSFLSFARNESSIVSLSCSEKTTFVPHFIFNRVEFTLNWSNSFQQ